MHARAGAPALGPTGGSGAHDGAARPRRL